MHVALSQTQLVPICIVVCADLQEAQCHLTQIRACQNTQVPVCAVLQCNLVQEPCQSALLLLNPARLISDCWTTVLWFRV